MTDSLVLRGADEVVAAIPPLLGFHPARSLVLLWLARDSRTLACAVRLDLTTPSIEVVRRLHSLAAQIGPGAVAMVAYPDSLAGWIDSADEDRLLALAEDLDPAVFTLVDFLVVCEGRYWSAVCTDPSCCPIGGHPVPTGTTELEAQAVLDGHHAVAAARADVLDLYRLRPERCPSPSALAAARDGEPLDPGQACDQALALIARHAGSTPPEAVRAELCWLLQQVDVRDWTLAHLCTPVPDLAGIDLLVDLALGAPDDLRPRLAGAAAAALYASSASSVGVWALLDHAGPDSLAQLVAASLDSCVPPTALQEVFAEALPSIGDRIRPDIPA